MNYTHFVTFPSKHCSTQGASKVSESASHSAEEAAEAMKQSLEEVLAASKYVWFGSFWKSWQEEI